MASSLLTCTPSNSESRDFFHVSLLKKYVKDDDRLIDWFVLQVEPDGEFQPDPKCISQKIVLMLRNQEIEQVKVQWKQFGPNEAT